MLRLRSLGAAAIGDFTTCARYMRSGLGRLGGLAGKLRSCASDIRTAKGGLVGVYDQHMYLDEKRAAWQKWGDHLSNLTTSIASSGKGLRVRSSGDKRQARIAANRERAKKLDRGES